MGPTQGLWFRRSGGSLRVSSQRVQLLGKDSTLELLWLLDCATESRTLTVATQGLKVRAAVPKLPAAGVAVTVVVLVKGFPAATLAGVGRHIQV